MQKTFGTPLASSRRTAVYSAPSSWEKAPSSWARVVISTPWLPAVPLAAMTAAPRAFRLGAYRLETV